MGMTSNLMHQDDDVNLEDLDDALHETFAPKEKKDVELKEDGDEENKEAEAPAVPEAPAYENEMSLTEQLEYSK